LRWQPARATLPGVHRCLTFLVFLLLVACGRTEPVRGYEYFLDPVDAGVVLGTDGGVIISGQCEGLAQSCPRGFHCEFGVCVLNGADAPLQVTLQWQNQPRTPVDLDLHLLEPARAGPCEIYYGTGIFTCQPVGRLDLDANAACADSARVAGLAFDTENIIYPVGRAVPAGHYVVRVDYWDECNVQSPVPFVVTVRKGTEVTRLTGTFLPGESTQGGAGAGVTVHEFDFP
jgi:hypothetical protein